MKTLPDYQLSYEKLYSCMRKYIWDFKVAEHLAEFEIALYSAFPDPLEVKKSFERLRSDVYRIVKDDEEMKIAFDEMDKLVHDDSAQYMKLISVREVQPNEGEKEDSSKQTSRRDNAGNKRRFSVGRITRS